MSNVRLKYHEMRERYRLALIARPSKGSNDMAISSNKLLKHSFFSRNAWIVHRNRNNIVKKSYIGHLLSIGLRDGVKLHIRIQDRCRNQEP